MDAAACVAGLRATFESGRTRPLEWRVRQLKALKRTLEDNREAWLRAVSSSCLKPLAEADLAELIVSQQELDTILANVGAWAAPEEVGTPLPLIPASSRVESQPYGVTLIIAPCNYPVLLAICPLAGALLLATVASCRHVAASNDSGAQLGTWDDTYLIFAR